MRIDRHSSRSGILLVECMIYISALAVLLAVAATAFYQFQMQSLHLQRNAHDIARTLQAGERWRADVRASEAAELLPGEQGPVLRLDCGTNEVRYGYSDGVVWRKKSVNAEWTPLLFEVKNSTMELESRTWAAVWHWNVELKTAQKAIRQRPLFSFLAVRGFKAKEAP